MIDHGDIVRTRSPAMQKVYDKIASVAPTKVTVLLTGETGTGKGVMARLIHDSSTRGEKEFVSVHCGAIPDTLIESELFGHEKGAFTGALLKKPGRFEIAEGGTIFLDEIGTISLAIQIKLLQVVQEKVFSRVGGEAAIKSDVRIIAATNSDLPAAIKAGRFRADLYYRLNIFPIEVPPLRDRIEDIPVLAGEFLDKCNRKHHKPIHSFSPLVREALLKYSWPGNVRELENLIERAYIMEPSSTLTPESFPAELFPETSEAPVQPDAPLPLARVRKEAVEIAERLYLERLLADYQGKIEVSAVAAGVGVRQMHKLLAKYKIEKGEFKPAHRKGPKGEAEL